jgi:hypothetical protein
VRNNRGNIILTSLFIAIFLFFLSVALIWTNRQDIALSLSMEHKLKAQSAARSGAFEALARLKQLGSLDGFQGKTYENGAKVEVDLVSLPASGRRGEVLKLRARGVSGPLSSYLTLHLCDVRLAGDKNSTEGRVLFFPTASGGGQASQETSEGTESQESQESQGGGGQALFGDFILKAGGAGVVSDMVAAHGPVFVSRDLAVADGAEGTPPSPPFFEDFIPVFSEDATQLAAWGATIVVAPPFGSAKKSITELQYLEYKDEAFEWVDIEPPKDLGDDEVQIVGQTNLFEIKAPKADTWTVATVRGIGDQVRNLAWVEPKPPTASARDIPGQPFVSEAVEPSATVDWSLASRTKASQQKFETRGAIAAHGNAVYSHGWHYVYNHYQGQAPGTITPLHGSTLTRWPCILKHELGGAWSKVWTPLTETGSVRTEVRPDPDVLLVASDGTIYSVTEPQKDVTRKLLTISGGSSAKVGDEVPPGRLFVYDDSPYLVPDQPEAPGILNLLNQKRIAFETLPAFLPELSGEVVDTSGTEQLILGIDGGYKGEALDSSKRRIVTARPRYDFRYSLSSAGPVAVDGEDLWAIMTITVSMLEPSYPAGYDELPIPENFGPVNVLARYDGSRWHILPNGLRAALMNGAPVAPGVGVIGAIYPGLPKQVSRYSVISMDTDPFRIGQ